MLKKPAVGSVFVLFRDDNTDSQPKKEERNIKLNNEKKKERRSREKGRENGSGERREDVLEKCLKVAC